MPKQNTTRLNKSTMIFLGITLLITLLYFSAIYFFNFEPDMFVIPIPFLIISIIFWIIQPIAIWKKPFVIIATTLLSSLVGVLFVILAVSMPGSHYHEYIDSNICQPAVAKYYGVKSISALPFESPANDLGKNWYRWYAQQLECVDNFYKGKGPVFSENPPGFLPLQSSQVKLQRPIADAEHSGEGIIEYANIEQGSGAQLVGVRGVGNFAVTKQTKIYDENNKQVEFSYLHKGQKVNISGRTGEGYLEAVEIKVQK